MSISPSPITIFSTMLSAIFRLAISAGTTNDNPVDFLYGAAVLETEPPDAFVQGADGSVWGATPLDLRELLPGTLQFTIHRTGYEPVSASLEIVANQTNTFQTNLVSASYTGGMKLAREYMAASDYAHTLQAVGDALIAKPDDAEALTLQREATGLGEIQRAQALGKQGDYIGGEQELTLALQSLPDNAEAKQLIVEFKPHELEQIEQERVERLNRPQTVFSAASANYPDAVLFDNHELTTSMPAKDAAAAIANALAMVHPIYKINENRSPKPETYFISAWQNDTGILTTSGRRQCLIVCGQTTDTNTEILFKVLEYKARHNISMTGLLDFRDNEEFIPINKSTITNMNDKLIVQLQAGVSNLTVRIQGAIGQAQDGNAIDIPK